MSQQPYAAEQWFGETHCMSLVTSLALPEAYASYNNPCRTLTVKSAIGSKSGYMVRTASIY